MVEVEEVVTVEVAMVEVMAADTQEVTAEVMVVVIMMMDTVVDTMTMDIVEVTVEAMAEAILQEEGIHQEEVTEEVILLEEATEAEEAEEVAMKVDPEAQEMEVKNQVIIHQNLKVQQIIENQEKVPVPQVTTMIEADFLDLHPDLLEEIDPDLQRDIKQVPLPKEIH